MIALKSTKCLSLTSLSILFLSSNNCRDCCGSIRINRADTNLHTL